MEERNYDFSTLSERISAQTQAYVEFSNALVKIIEQTAAIRDTNNHLLDDYKNLNEKFQKLLVDFNTFSFQANSSFQDLDRDLVVIKTSLEDYEKQLKELIEEMNERNTTLFDMIEELTKHSEQVKEHISSDNNGVKKALEDLSLRVENQNALIAEFKKSIDKFKMFFWAVGGFLSIMGALSQFGIISITWFKK
jgi:chromosome segregation ATPase